MIKHRAVRAVACTLLAAAGCQQTDGTRQKRLADGPDITLDSIIQYQTIVGWEAHSQSGEADFPNFPQYSDQLFDLAIDSLGITRIRLEAWSGIENTRSYWLDFQAGRMDYRTWRCHRFATINDNADPDSINWSGFHFDAMDTTVVRVVLPLVKRMQARGEKLYINLTYDSFILQCPTATYHHDNIAEYAEFALAVMLHLRSTYGIVPDAWEMILEPDNSRWRGRAIGEAMMATAERFRRHGFTPDFVAPSTASMAKAAEYFDDMIKVPGVSGQLKELSYHRYKGVSPDALWNIVERARRYNLRTSMLEHIPAGYKTLHRDLKFGNVTAWQQFALAWSGEGKRGGAYLLLPRKDSKSSEVRLSPRSWFFRQYFLFIRPGARRIEATAPSQTIDPVAFVNADGRYVVVVVTTRGETFTIGNLPSGRYGLKYTTEERRGIDLPDVELAPNSVLEADIPAAGVLTVYGK